MKMLVFVFLTLGSLVANATYIPSDCTLKIAGRCFTKAENDRFESGTLAAGGGVILTTTVTVVNLASGFKLQDGTDFQVPAGTTANCMAFRASVSSATVAASYDVYLAYNDNPVIQNQGSYGVNPVTYGGGAAASSYVAFTINQSPTENILKWSIPAGKYPLIGTNGVPTNVTAWCFID